MKPPVFNYFDPTTVAEAVDLLGSMEGAKLLAGGQSLMPMLNMRFVLPDTIIDLNKVSELSFIRREVGYIDFGAMTRQREIEYSEEVRSCCPIVIEAIKNVGHRQTRNRGTFGGSLCHLDPAAELPTVAMVLDATIDVVGPNGRRELKFSEFPLGYMSPAIDLNEVVTKVRLPIWSRNHGFAFVEFARRHGDFAIASVAVLLELDADGRIVKVAVAVGGIAAVPQRMDEMEAALIGEIAGDDLFKKVSTLCRKLEVLEDVHVPASYRLHLGEVLTVRALRLAHKRAKERQTA